ncbi:alcohol dehydrogenase catalytic domain-containing protein [Rhizorhabdus argentea]|uniref:alcohol dehydrogenase catalytic domain-containing protein n=1 Tax=Rhizorhabdus argentea TaxID=1387174 RepID=UPI0030EC07C8
MRAAIFKEVGQPLEIVELPEPEPAADEVVVSVGRCGICGSDLHMTDTGGMPPASRSVIGHEFSGEVVAIGRDVSNLKIGDRVAAMPIKGCGKCNSCKAGTPSWCEQGLQYLAGGYAQYARAGARECLLLPGGLDVADGALAEPLAVALHGVRTVPDLKGATVTVMGGGPIGLAAVFWARHFGAAKVQIVEGNVFRGEMALGMGADQLFAPPAPSTGTPGQAESVDPASIPAPADVVFECVGKPGLLLSSLDRVRPCSTIVSLGFCMSQEPFFAAAAATREVTMKFPMLYTIDDYQTTLNVLESGAVESRAMVTNTVSLDELPKMFEALRKPSHECKVMIDPWKV